MTGEKRLLSLILESLPDGRLSNYNDLYNITHFRGVGHLVIICKIALPYILEL